MPAILPDNSPRRPFAHLDAVDCRPINRLPDRWALRLWLGVVLVLAAVFMWLIYNG